MLATPIGRGRLLAGAATLAVASVTLLGVTASGSRAATAVRTTVERTTGVELDRLTPAALFQSEGPDAPAAPPGPTAPGSGGRHVATVRDHGTTHVTVTEDGRTRRLDGAAAEAWLAANPAPTPEPGTRHRQVSTVRVDGRTRVTVIEDGRTRRLEGAEADAWIAANPVPPAPPAPAAGSPPPAPPAPLAALDALRGMPQVVSGACGAGSDRMTTTRTEGGRRVTVICADRIAAVERHAAVAAVDAGRIRRDALRSALASLRSSRVALANERGAQRISAAERAGALADIDASIAEVEREAASRN